MHTIDSEESGIFWAPMISERLRMEMALLALATEEKTSAGIKEIAGMYAVMLEDKESCRILLLHAEDLAAGDQELNEVADAWITFLEDKEAANRCRCKVGVMFQGVT